MTQTPPLPFETHDAEAIGRALAQHYAAERDALLAQVASIEKRWLGYGTPERPTTAELRELWRKSGGRCPDCGRELWISPRT